jgi:hypothetical protein
MSKNIKLSFKFSYVIIIYQVWNSGNTLNIFLTPRAISILLLIYQQIFNVLKNTWQIVIDYN